MRTRKSLYNIITNLLLQIVIIAYGFIVPKIIIDNFGSEINGLVASITQLLSYITLLESGFGPVILSVLYKPIAEKNNQKIKKILKASEKFFKRIALLFLIYIAVLMLTYPVIDKSIPALSTMSLVAIIAISTFFEYYFGITYRLFLQAKQKQYIISIIQIASYIISTIIILILANTGASIHILKLLSGLIFAIKPLIQNYYVKKKYGIVLNNVNDEYKVKQKWDGLAQHIAFVIHTNTDITILTFLTRITEVSVYSVYYLVVCGVKKIVLSFSSGIESAFGDMIAKDEKTILRKRFNTYEVLFNILSVIAFSSTIVLITPFIEVYTKGITDADYIRPLFAALLTISEYIWIIRQPYNTLIKAAGHFKQTRKGAWIECITNIVISIMLVNWLGIIGVAIGTIVAMTIRTIEFVYHTNKYILHRSIWESTKKILLVTIETVIIVAICNFLPYVENSNYFNWIINALMVAGVAIIVALGLNFIFFRKELASVKGLIKSITKKKKL